MQHKNRNIKKMRWKVPKNVQNRSRQNSQIRECVCVSLLHPLSTMARKSRCWPHDDPKPKLLLLPLFLFLFPLPLLMSSKQRWWWFSPFFWTSFRPQTKAGIFVTDCISLHILFVYVPARVCMCVCASECLCALPGALAKQCALCAVFARHLHVFPHFHFPHAFPISHFHAKNVQNAK